MKRLLKIVGCIMGCVLGLIGALHMSFWLLLMWDMSPKSWDADNSEFQSVAITPLPDVICGSLPAGFRVTHYYRKKNFNDGDELWRLEVLDPNALPKLVKQLRMKPGIQVQNLLGAVDNKPDWVLRPNQDTKLLYVDDQKQVHEASKECKFGIFYIWSNDGNAVFLYHIIT